MFAEAKDPNRVIVVGGTGTEVGKTHVAAALARRCVAIGIPVVGLKPVESGLDGAAVGADATELAAAGSFHVKQSLYQFQEPISPHLAARRSGQTISLRAISQWVAKQPPGLRVVETAGGLFTPLSDQESNLDLALALAPSCIVLVAPDRLGVLHDVIATTTALRLRHPAHPPLHLVLSAPAEADASTGSNQAELIRLAVAASIHTFPRCPQGHTATAVAAHGLLEAIQPAPPGGIRESTNA